MDVPDTRHLLHAYGLATDAAAHLAVLSHSDAGAIAKAGTYLTSAIIHQGTPWPATGPVVGYVCSLVLDGTLSAAARPVVAEFLAEVASAIEVAEGEGGAGWLRTQIADNSFDLDGAVAQMAELSDDDAESAYEEMFDDDDVADLIMYIAFLGVVERAAEVDAARALLSGLK